MDFEARDTDLVHIPALPLNGFMSWRKSLSLSWPQFLTQKKGGGGVDNGIIPTFQTMSRLN